MCGAPITLKYEASDLASLFFLVVLEEMGRIFWCTKMIQPLQGVGPMLM